MGVKLTAKFHAALLAIVLSIGCAEGREAEVKANFSEPEVVSFISCVVRNEEDAQSKCSIDKRLINTPGKDGETPLLWLLTHERISPGTMVAVVRSGADVYAGSEPAIGFVVRELSLSYLAALVNAGVDINGPPLPEGASRGFDHSPMFSAIMAQDVEKVKFLIKNGSKLEIRNEAGETPLLFADLNTYDIQILLLQAGADPYAKNKHGQGVCWPIENRPFPSVSADTPPSEKRALARFKAAREKFLAMLESRGIRCKPYSDPTASL